MAKANNNPPPNHPTAVRSFCFNLKTQLVKKSDTNEIEKTIRNKLNMLKQDEVAIILRQPTPTPLLITPTPLPNYLQWWQVFF